MFNKKIKTNNYKIIVKIIEIITKVRKKSYKNMNEQVVWVVYDVFVGCVADLQFFNLRFKKTIPKQL